MNEESTGIKLQNGTQKAKNPGELGRFGKVSSSCSTSGTRRVSCRTFKNPATD